MTVEIGHFALILAFTLSLAQFVVPLAGTRIGDERLIAVSGPVTIMAFALTALSFAVLTVAYVQSDFSLVNVWENSHSAKPMLYKVTGVWGNHEGSMLLWVLILTFFGALVAWFGTNLPASLRANVLSVQGLVGAAFLLFILATSNPFTRLDPAPLEGRDLNPILQDIGLAVHPPLLYLGYVGFSISFSFAVAALIEGRIDAAWARWVRPWTLTAWIFLTGGIAMGSYWAYYELGWGGWWFWDPVENASFLPWLSGTALLHSAIVMEKRSALKIWTLLLAILTFSLSLLGTFLVRSGVLTSVHAFATDPARGSFILAFLALVVGAALALYAWRAPALAQSVRFTWLSREASLLLNNVFLVAACAAVFIGTLFPLLMDALGGGKFSVGPPYFNRVLTPLWLALLFFLSIAPSLHWRENKWVRFARRSYICWAAALLLGALTPLLFGEWRWGVALALALAWGVLLAAAQDIVQRLRNTGRGLSWGQALRRQPRAFIGMHLAHIGLAVFAMGATVVTAYETEYDAVIMPRETLTLGEHQVTFQNLQGFVGPNYEALIGHFRIADENGRVMGLLRPEKRQYVSGGEPMTEAAIMRNFLGDIYISLGEMQGSDRATSGWLIRLYTKPLMGWVWAGCLFMVLGGGLAMTDPRYRRRKVKEKAEHPGSAPAYRPTYSEPPKETA